MFCRYLSMMAILFSNIGFFYHGFSPKVCAHYGYLGPVFKGKVPVPYAAWIPEADKSSSHPDHGVPRNTGGSVSLGHAVPRHRV